MADPDSNQVSVISTKTDTVTSTISLAGGPDALALTPDGSQLWVCGLTSGILTVLDTSNDSVVGSRQPRRLGRQLRRRHGPDRYRADLYPHPRRKLASNSPTA